MKHLLIIIVKKENFKLSLYINNNFSFFLLWSISLNLKLMLVAYYYYFFLLNLVLCEESIDYFKQITSFETLISSEIK
jgi:hypothetical protein